MAELREGKNILHEDLPRGEEREIIEFYFHKGFQYKHIVLMLDKHHGVTMNVRTLQRRLQDYGLSRRQPLDDDQLEHARSLISREIESGPGSLHGYRTMWHVLRLRHHLSVPRRIVENLVKEIDPIGVILIILIIRIRLAYQPLMRSSRGYAQAVT